MGKHNVVGISYEELLFAVLAISLDNELETLEELTEYLEENQSKAIRITKHAPKR